MELEEKLIKKGTETLEKEVNKELKKGTFLNSFKFSYLVLFIFLAISMHPDLLTNPMDRFSSLPDSAVFMGEQLGSLLLKSTRFKNIDLIIPVPLHPAKFKKRGFNQAERIAVGMGCKLNIPVNTTALIRVEHNETQTKKALFSRWANVKTIFRLVSSEELKNKHVLLVDDVITSGSTIEACANQILKVQNTKVSLASLAVASG